MAVGPGELGVQVHRAPVAHRGGEHGIVTGGERAAPVVRQHPTDREVLELVALGDERKRRKVQVAHDPPVVDDERTLTQWLLVDKQSLDDRDFRQWNCSRSLPRRSHRPTRATTVSSYAIWPVSSP